MFSIHSSTYPIGLDISDLSLKLIQLNKTRDKITIQALNKLSLPPGIIVNGIIKNEPELIKAIRKIVANPLYGKVSSEEVVACLPESKTFVKLIEVQKSPNALQDVIGSEIEKHVPLAIADIYYDWQTITELNDKYFVLIGAAPKEIVKAYSNVLDHARLSMAALEVEPVAIARCLLKEEAPGSKIKFGKKNSPEPSLNYGLIDIGANHTCMIFYSGNTILFTVSMPISGEEITSKIAKALSITQEQAEKAKIICGMDETMADGVIKEILAETIKNLTAKIKESVQYYENYFGQLGPLNRILLSGGGANIINLAEILNAELAIEIKISNALINLNEKKEKFEEFFMERHNLDLDTAKFNSESKGKKLTIEQNSSSNYATAIGLALRGIFIDEI
ncbi:MAG: pilus assembly protein PilM [Patescibacteria group bacterium]|nr:pilus assembly protein PilM [Patescibacteria group bacterium]